MNIFASRIKKELQNAIQKVVARVNDFVEKPDKDLSRNRKLPTIKVLMISLLMGGKSLNTELLELFDFDINLPTSSAYIQQRDKLSLSAFEYLYSEFTNCCTDFKTFEGYRLLAVDGSSFNISYNPNDEKTHFESKTNAKGYNQLHLNALYDLKNKIYVDAIVQNGKEKNENKAFIDMIDRGKINDKVIVTADRAYESYNDFAHIQNKNWNYVMRVKDSNSNGIASNLSLPDTEEFDVDIKLFLTKKQTKETTLSPKTHKFLRSNVTFDYLDKDSEDYYELSFRAVRIRITENTYEMLFTNLNRHKFPPEKLKIIYNLRWGIETSFRDLKCTIGAVNFHCKSTENIKKEIFSKLTMYNFCELITNKAVISNSKSKLTYEVNFTQAVTICKEFFKRKDSDKELDIGALLEKYTHPLRENRVFERKIKSKSVVSFLYRLT